MAARSKVDARVEGTKGEVNHGTSMENVRSNFERNTGGRGPALGRSSDPQRRWNAITAKARRLFILTNAASDGRPAKGIWMASLRLTICWMSSWNLADLEEAMEEVGMSRRVRRKVSTGSRNGQHWDESG
ncbi:hypothetical protein ATY79_26640 [Rhizobium sp. R693]|nr:hypothetical protein ATY79_26640 [Rhizobium sp. R693]